MHRVRKPRLGGFIGIEIIIHKKIRVQAPRETGTNSYLPRRGGEGGKEEGGRRIIYISNC